MLAEKAAKRKEAEQAYRAKFTKPNSTYAKWGLGDQVANNYQEIFGKPFEGEGYYVVRVCHTWDRKSGFRTHFEAHRATLNGASL